MDSNIKTKRDALRWCRKLWLWNAKNSETDKWSSPYPVRKWVCGCPCCSYVEDVKGISIGSNPKCAAVCPLSHIWPKGCEHEPSPYYDYLYADEVEGITKEGINIQRSRAAKVIADACKEKRKKK